MSRSDNAPVGSMCMMPTNGPDGTFSVYVGVKVCNVILSPIRVPTGGIIMVDQNSLGENSFIVIYENMPEHRDFVEFSFTVQ